jgi:hypothetical protein
MVSSLSVNQRKAIRFRRLGCASGAGTQLAEARLDATEVSFSAEYRMHRCRPKDRKMLVDLCLKR